MKKIIFLKLQASVSIFYKYVFMLRAILLGITAPGFEFSFSLLFFGFCVVHSVRLFNSNQFLVIFLIASVSVSWVFLKTNSKGKV